MPFQVEKQVVRLKQDKPSWGAPKIREKLARLYPDVHTPAISTVHAVLVLREEDAHVLRGKPAAAARARSRYREFPRIDSHNKRGADRAYDQGLGGNN